MHYEISRKSRGIQAGGVDHALLDGAACALGFGLFPVELAWHVGYSNGAPVAAV
ncbi:MULTISPECIES: hypothetical protein [unclassified Rhizobium]|uniref:hypothetical protein n=1 Tax=unclassified Rhizobium TaxID=2613769 RepID=UPI002168DFC9|nr:MULTISPECIES: hypothetical protein [unclassified Rhizobium]MCS3743374.1 hypothetical protein [Rhizobium sp. BK661]MCS4095899.1 hypothetical protein [Rhizobium sp. BK176]